jgi:hypothetical protein
VLENPGRGLTLPGGRLRVPCIREDLTKLDVYWEVHLGRPGSVTIVRIVADEVHTIVGRGLPISGTAQEQHDGHRSGCSAGTRAHIGEEKVGRKSGTKGWVKPTPWGVG